MGIGMQFNRASEVQELKGKKFNPGSAVGIEVASIENQNKTSLISV